MTILFTNHHSSCGIKPQTLTLISLDFFRKIEPILIIQSAISRGVSNGILLVPHIITILFMDDGKGKLIARHRTFLIRSPLMPKVNTFIEVKYSFLTFGYLLRPATMVFPSRRVLEFESSIITQWLRWYSTQLDLTFSWN